MIRAREVDANYAALSAQIDRLAEFEAPSPAAAAVGCLSEAEVLDREAALEGRAPWWRRLAAWIWGRA